MNKEGLYKENPVWIETVTGKRVNPLELKAEDIDIADIAGPLSRICRFVGQCRRFYSVEQHCIHVADLVEGEMMKQIGSDDAWKQVGHIEEVNRTCLAALLHDSPEAYTNDISRPVKYAIKGFKEIENKIMGIVMQKYGCIGVDWALIKKADNIMLATEALQLMPSKGDGWYLPEPPLDHDIPTLSFEEVENFFMERFFRFGGK